MSAMTLSQTPWFSEVDIGFRLSCLPGVRTQMTRSRVRTGELTGQALNLEDANTIIPMLSPPPRRCSPRGS